MKPESIKKAIRRALKRGNWFLRRSNNGKSYEDFQWKPLGEWTIALDWDPNPTPGGGLHGNDSDTKHCYWQTGSRIDFCEYDLTESVRLLSGKIKTRRARILAHHIPAGIEKWEGSLNLRGVTIPEGTVFPKYVGTLYLQRAIIPEGTVLPKHVDSLNLRGVTIPEGTVFPKRVGAIDLRSATIPEGTLMPKVYRKIYR